MKAWVGCLWLVLAVFIGGALFSGVRTLYYIVAELHPNIGPQMFIAVSPILSAPIALIATLVHVLFRSEFGYDAYWKWFIAGISYSSILLGLISPWLLLIPIALNPVTAKVIRGNSTTKVVG